MFDGPARSSKTRDGSVMFSIPHQCVPVPNFFFLVLRQHSPLDFRSKCPWTAWSRTWTESNDQRLYIKSRAKERKDRPRRERKGDICRWLEQVYQQIWPRKTIQNGAHAFCASQTCLTPARSVVRNCQRGEDGYGRKRTFERLCIRWVWRRGAFLFF